VLGGTGYVAGELLRLLAAHPHFRLAAVMSDSQPGGAKAAVRDATVRGIFRGAARGFGRAHRPAADGGRTGRRRTARGRHLG